MGDSLLFLVTFIGVSWLCVWIMREPKDGKSRSWSPFDMRDPAAPDPRPAEPESDRRRQ